MNDRQMQIVEAAIPLFLSNGVGVSTANVAKAAGVSNGTLFNAFATKQDLIDAMYLSAKLGMFEALAFEPGAGFDRASVRRNWTNYLNWARRRPQDRQIMHVLLEAGMVSDAVIKQVDELAAQQSQWIAAALEHGAIRGPNVEFIVKLIFFQIDLVIALNLNGEDETLAFDMLCQSIGLTS